ncbi:hypothetical protein EGR_07745 [Echinococcus granulosus]|uniref:Uncharacterized protein n=1 Tax=Echinococcus granulosus TaxID=6210 RepID=W6UA66_ECHGR|nr:hypothetical protein EGR_07745 [Echinococcus granulosus]EUB57421.1 hypothetical protein EGR_07745 [Echinococcus granulosus]
MQETNNLFNKLSRLHLKCSNNKFKRDITITTQIQVKIINLVRTFHKKNSPYSLFSSPFHFHHYHDNMGLPKRDSASPLGDPIKESTECKNHRREQAESVQVESKFDEKRLDGHLKHPEKAFKKFALLKQIDVTKLWVVKLLAKVLATMTDQHLLVSNKLIVALTRRPKDEDFEVGIRINLVLVTDFSYGTLLVIGASVGLLAVVAFVTTSCRKKKDSSVKYVFHLFYLKNGFCNKFCEVTSDIPISKWWQFDHFQDLKMLTNLCLVLTEYIFINDTLGRHGVCSNFPVETEINNSEVNKGRRQCQSTQIMKTISRFQGMLFLP